nr:NAD kinase [Saprospiraceae bacterium]
MRIGVYGQTINDRDLSWVVSFLEKLISDGHHLSVYHAFAELLPESLRKKTLSGIIESVDDTIDRELDFFLSLGGDGTMLRAVNFTYQSNVPVLGINLGRLGFLASVEKRNAIDAVNKIALGEYNIQKRTLLELGGNNNLFAPDPVALNDFTVSKRDASSMINIHTYIDGEFFNTYWSDGLIISTPTGSTGYSLSCGGPIVFPCSGNLVVTPIAPHNLNVRPIVISDTSQITVELEGRTDSFLCSLDSRYEAITSADHLVIKKSKFVGRIIMMKNYSYAESLREKLTWGVDKRRLN